MCQFSAFLTAVALFLSASNQVNGHGQMTFPKPRPDKFGKSVSYGNTVPIYDTFGAINGPHYADYGQPTPWGMTDFRCRGQTEKSPQRQTLRAGEDFTFTFRFEANHPGDCFLYLSDPKQERQASPSKWFKIFEYPGCGAPDGRGPPNKQYISKTFTVPEGVPECEDCVLRWE
eukprot:Pgem_evm1s10169